MKKNKGQIVPRYLVDAIEPKSRHLVKFGCDVEITGRTIKATSKGGYIIEIPDIRKVSNGRRTVKGFNFSHCNFDGNGLTCGAISLGLDCPFSALDLAMQTHET